MKERAEEILLKTRVVELRETKRGVEVKLSGADLEDAREYDRVLIATGRSPNSGNIGLEKMQVRVDNRGFIDVDLQRRTGEPSIFAIGDVAGGPMLAHKAQHEGVVCVEAIAGGSPAPIDLGRIPACTYCSPQVASVGLTEKAAREEGREIRVGRFPFIGNGKAVALGETDGLAKTVFDAASGRLIGAHLVGPEVTELIQGFVIAMNLETTEAELINTVFPHPTLSESMHEAVLSAFGRVIHI
jgi:dihydrolipoamide dehydrogenase